MATIINFEGVLRDRDPQFGVELEAVEACITLQAHFEGATLSPAEVASALETISRSIPVVEGNAQ